MSKAKWKFLLAYQGPRESLLELRESPMSVVAALRAAGFGVLEAETVSEELLETTELGMAVRKDSEIDPFKLVQNLKRAGVHVRWLNEPAA